MLKKEEEGQSCGMTDTTAREGHGHRHRVPREEVLLQG